MKILITGANTPLATTISERISADHEVVATDAESEPANGRLLDLRELEGECELLDGVEVILHCGVLPSDCGDEQHVLDFANRGTFNLLNAAKAAGVRRFIHFSTLDFMTDKVDEYWVDERFKPRPDTEATQLAHFLVEKMAYQFAIETPIEVISLRLANGVLEEETSDQEFDPDWVDLRDVAQAAEKALDFELPDRYRIFHIAANTFESRWEVGHAVQSLGYRPEHNFGGATRRDRDGRIVTNS
ncbi:MAG: NAD(P)-dependent oxidoreductase [Planctomycetota bacterium]|jgi:nucleoside-diphosphate-sugar epimerase|nr:NAD(P)-dependent oxidoreductase [Planctomycetota bacterium]MDP7250171.1 NAD(P)-dependent oxidoreductase [Planctomycetota bacterium]